MNILFLSAWCPWPADNGSKLRIYHLLRGLSQRHQVDLLCFAPEPLTTAHEQHLRGLCRRVGLLRTTPFAAHRTGRLLGALSPRPRSVVGNYSREMAGLVRKYAAQQRYDVIVASELHMAPYALTVDKIPRVLDDIEIVAIAERYLNARSPLHRARNGLTWWKLHHYLTTMLRRFVGVSVPSEQEGRFVRSCISGNTSLAVVPNGVDVKAFSSFNQVAEVDTLIYPGALSYDANFDAVDHFLGTMLPQIRQKRPAVRLRVTGRTTRELLAALPPVEGVEFTGYIDDIRTLIARSWVEVVPLRKGGGTRLKVLEALALGTPVVSTPKGVEGLDLKYGSEVLVATNVAEFAAHTVQLLESPALRQDLSARGRSAAARYDWSKSVDRLDDLLNRAVAA